MIDSKLHQHTGLGFTLVQSTGAVTQENIINCILHFLRPKALLTEYVKIFNYNIYSYNTYVSQEGKFMAVIQIWNRER